MHKYIKAFMTCVTICCTANEAKKEAKSFIFHIICLCKWVMVGNGIMKEQPTPGHETAQHSTVPLLLSLCEWITVQKNVNFSI